MSTTQRKEKDEKDPTAVAMGRRLDAEMKAAQLSQPRLAAMIGVGKGTVGNWVSGIRKIRPVQAKKLEGIFRKPAAYFLLEMSAEEADIINSMRKHRPSQ